MRTRCYLLVIGQPLFVVAGVVGVVVVAVVGDFVAWTRTAKRIDR